VHIKINYNKIFLSPEQIIVEILSTIIHVYVWLFDKCIIKDYLQGKVIIKLLKFIDSLWFIIKVIFAKYFQYNSLSQNRGQYNF
jgi:hypothetical protein